MNLYSGSHINQQSTSVKKQKVSSDLKAKVAQDTQKYNNAMKLELPDLQAQGKGLIDIMTAYHKGTTAVTNYELEAGKAATKGVGQIAEAFLVEPEKERVANERAAANMFWTQNGSTLDEIYQLEEIQKALTDGQKTKNLIAKALTEATGNDTAASEFLSFDNYGHIALKQAQLQARGDNADAAWNERLLGWQNDNTVHRKGEVDEAGNSLEFTAAEFNQLTADQKNYLYDSFIASELTEGYNGLSEANTYKYLGTPLNNWRKEHAVTANTRGRVERANKALDTIDLDSTTKIRSAIQSNKPKEAVDLLVSRFELARPHYQQLLNDGRLGPNETVASRFIKDFQNYGNNLISSASLQDVEGIRDILVKAVEKEQDLPFGKMLGENSKISKSHWWEKTIERQTEIYNENNRRWESGAGNLLAQALADQELFVASDGQNGKLFPPPAERKTIVEEFLSAKGNEGASGNATVMKSIASFLNWKPIIKDEAESLKKAENNYDTQGKIQTRVGNLGIDPDTLALTDTAFGVHYRETAFGQGSDKEAYADLKADAEAIFLGGKSILESKKFGNIKQSKIELARKQEREVMLRAQEIAIQHWLDTGGKNGGVWLADAKVYKQALIEKKAEYDADEQLPTTQRRFLANEKGQYPSSSLRVSTDLRYSEDMEVYGDQLDILQDIRSRGGALEARKLNLTQDFPELLEVGPGGEPKAAAAYMARLLEYPTVENFINDQKSLQNQPITETPQESFALKNIFSNNVAELQKINLINGGGKLNPKALNKKLESNGVFITASHMNTCFVRHTKISQGGNWFTKIFGPSFGPLERKMAEGKSRNAYEACLQENNEWKAAWKYGEMMGLPREQIGRFLDDLRIHGVTNKWFRPSIDSKLNINPQPIEYMNYEEPNK